MADTDVNEAGRGEASGEIRCPMCGATIAASSRTCLFCGEKIAASVGLLVARTEIIFIGFKVFAVLGCGLVLIALLLPVFPRRAGEAARRAQCKNNLHNIALALHNYEADYGALPPAFTIDAYGQRLHSWRTLILPYLDQRQLYERIDLSKPWDDPANAEAREARVQIYHCASDRCPPDHTTYLANIASGGCFRLTEPRLLSEITDGTSNTVMVIEVPSENAVPWMSPQDADEALIMSMGPEAKTAHEGGAHAALCDGSVRFLSATLPVATRRALITIEGGERIGEF
jgi:hypothetical protein